MRLLSAVALALSTIAPQAVLAQYRENQPAVVEPPPPPAVEDPRPAIIGAFARDFAAGGRPRIVLFWAVAFDDNLEIDRRKVKRTEETESSTGNSLEKTTSGPAGNATLRDQDSTKKKSGLTEEYSVQSDTSKKPLPFSARDTVELKQAFLFAMRQGGVNFVDRDVILRTSSAALSSKDTKAVETQAALSGAKFILEVLPVADDRSPTGIGFALSLKEVAAGVDAASSYTHALPWLPPGPPPKYVATAKGFELRAPPRPKPTMHDFGTALAIDVMRTIGPAIGGGRSLSGK